MTDPLTFYTLVLAFAAVGMAAMAILGLSRRAVAGAPFFVLLCLGGFFYAFGSIFEIRSEDAREMLGWLTFEYIGISLLGPCWMNAAVRLGGDLPRRGRLLAHLSFLPSVAVIALVSTNGSHQLFYASFELERHGPFTVAIVERGPAYLLHYAYFILCSVVGMASALRIAARSGGMLRGQALLLLAGLLVPWLANLLYLVGLSPWGLDTAPVGIALSCLVLGYALFRYRLFELAPLAFENVFQGTPDAVLVFDDRERFLAANPAWAGLFPEAGAYEVGSPAESILASRPSLLETLRRVDGGHIDFRAGEGEGERSFEAVSSPLRDRRGRERGRILTLHDVTQMVALLRRLERQAMTDGLTGVANRRHFFEAAERELARTRRAGPGAALAVAIMDLDHFKLINDSRGHQAGDEVLVAVARRCAELLRAGDLFARHGGEEFAVLLPDAGAEAARQTAERLRAAVEALRIVSAGVAIPVTVSVGVATLPAGGDSSLEGLLGAADRALYRAKAEGRNRVVMAGDSQA